ncbi:MAG: hypothetical protein ACTHNK_16330, partial [Thermomicrobiales bacterium]
VSAMPNCGRGGVDDYPGLKFEAEWLRPQSPPARPGFITMPGLAASAQGDQPQSAQADFVAP